mmetsp:Transcript_67448/g.186031  ORF Transcript_67448/g.186031 Transcript_67448/m.186031 type:complete len:246 (-) Transcript_67448:363-1100(-)
MRFSARFFQTPKQAVEQAVRPASTTSVRISARPQSSTANKVRWVCCSGGRAVSSARGRSWTCVHGISLRPTRRRRPPAARLTSRPPPYNVLLRVVLRDLPDKCARVLIPFVGLHQRDHLVVREGGRGLPHLELVDESVVPVVIHSAVQESHAAVRVHTRPVRVKRLPVEAIKPQEVDERVVRPGFLVIQPVLLRELPKLLIRASLPHHLPELVLLVVVLCEAVDHVQGRGVGCLGLPKLAPRPRV